ncbi:MAG TPA: protein kinase [Bryobacteraceae bacterium]|jgi:serine/threonine protein kinase|nr:protein kinase [Bryobacteraceae bacterium]
MRKFFWARETETEAALDLRPQGTSLADRIAAGPLPVREALRYAIATAESLRAVHGRGRAYATLQPASILIQQDGVQFVPSGAVAITPYFSPEQVQGRELDLRSDIFSLGALLYEMLSGRKAFAAATKPALRFEILDGEPAPLENVPPAVARLVMRCLEKRPERRMQRMEILLAALKLQEIVSSPTARAAG